MSMVLVLQNSFDIFSCGVFSLLLLYKVPKFLFSSHTEKKSFQNNRIFIFTCLKSQRAYLLKWWISKLKNLSSSVDLLTNLSLLFTTSLLSFMHNTFSSYFLEYIMQDFFFPLSIICKKPCSLINAAQQMLFSVSPPFHHTKYEVMVEYVKHCSTWISCSSFIIQEKI